MASSSWFSNTNRVQAKGVAAVMLIRRLGRLFLGGVLLVGSLGAVAADKTTPVYTADLNRWGPGENKLKMSPLEPRFMALEEAEKDKVIECSSGAFSASAIMRHAAMTEALIDILAKDGSVPRKQPLGEVAEEEFRGAVSLEISRRALSELYSPGATVALLYGPHFGFQFWKEYYKSILEDSDDLLGTKTNLNNKVTDEFWSLCLQQVPTACFEQGPADPQRCLSKLIHPRNFPNLEVTSDLFQGVLKPNGW